MDPEVASPASPGEGNRSEVEEVISLSIHGGRSGEEPLDGLAAIWCDDAEVSAMAYTDGELSIPGDATTVLVIAEGHVPAVEGVAQSTRADDVVEWPILSIVSIILLLPNTIWCP